MSAIRLLSEKEEKILLSAFETTVCYLYPTLSWSKLEQHLKIDTLAIPSSGVRYYRKQFFNVVIEQYGHFLNIYFVSDQHTNTLISHIADRKNDHAASYLVFVGTLPRGDQVLELRVGVFGVPCATVAKSLVRATFRTYNDGCA